MSLRWPCQVLPCDHLAEHAVHRRQGSATVLTMACEEGLAILRRETPDSILRVVRLSDSVPPPPVSGTTRVATPVRKVG